MVLRTSGIVRGNTVILDEPLSEMDGHRVSVELRKDPSAPTAEELARAWADWVQGGEQGPISDEGEAWPP